MKKIYFLLFCCISATRLLAADYYWIGGAGPSNWDLASNWSATSNGSAGTLTPAANDRVYFSNGGAVTVNYNIASVGFADFAVTNNTQLTLISTVAATRTFGLNATGTSYY